MIQSSTCHGKDAARVAANLSIAIEKVAKWLNDACLTLNVGKTATMCFTDKQKRKEYTDISKNGEKF